MTHWSVRLAAKTKERGWSARELARRTGLSHDSIYKYMSGNVEAPRGDTMKRLAHALGVNPIWLEHGETTENHSRRTGVSDISRLKKLPVLALVELGRLHHLGELQKLLWSEEVAVLETVTVEDTGGEALVAGRLEDASMAPAYPAGCIVVCDMNLPPEPGKLVLAVSRVAKQAVFRRFRSTSAHDPTKGELIAENPDYPILRFQSERDGFIVGRVVQVIHKIK